MENYAKNENKLPTAFITGASSGMGAAIAQQLSEKNYNLVLTGRQSIKLDEVANLCKTSKNKIFTIVADLQNKKLFEENWQAAIAAMGEINHVVLNHGVGYFLPFEEDDHWEETIDINLKSHMFITKIILPHLIKQADLGKPCSIIYIASTLAKAAIANAASYCASKHGLLGFAKCIYEEVRHKGIKISVICPGYVNTPMVHSHGVDIDKMIQPDDVAELVTYILQSPNTICPFEITIRPQQMD